MSLTEKGFRWQSWISVKYYKLTLYHFCFDFWNWFQCINLDIFHHCLLHSEVWFHMRSSFFECVNLCRLLRTRFCSKDSFTKILRGNFFFPNPGDECDGSPVCENADSQHVTECPLCFRWAVCSLTLLWRL